MGVRAMRVNHGVRVAPPTGEGGRRPVRNFAHDLGLDARLTTSAPTATRRSARRRGCAGARRGEDEPRRKATRRRNGPPASGERPQAWSLGVPAADERGVRGVEQRMATRTNRRPQWDASVRARAASGGVVVSRASGAGPARVSRPCAPPAFTCGRRRAPSSPSARGANPHRFSAANPTPEGAARAQRSGRSGRRGFCNCARECSAWRRGGKQAAGSPLVAGPSGESRGTGAGKVPPGLRRSTWNIRGRAAARRGSCSGPARERRG
jgi:hypothetical protein